MYISVEDVDPLLKEDLSDFQTAGFENMLKELLWRASKSSSAPYTDMLGNLLLAAALEAVQHSCKDNMRKSITKNLDD